MSLVSPVMQKRRLGQSQILTPPLVLGGNVFGWTLNEAGSFRILDEFVGAGFDFIDTADAYSNFIPGNVGGESETIIGKWLAQRGNRDRVVIATKVGMRMGPDMRGLSKAYIFRAVEDSLRRLQTDYIDLYQMHHVDRATPWDEIWEAMEVLRFQGKILYAGSSNFAGWHIAKAQEAARRRNFPGLVCEQSLYNLFVRDVEREVLPAAEDYGVGIIAWSPLQGGLLGGILGKEEGPGRRFEDERAKNTVRDKRDQIEGYEALCKEIGEEPANVALAWLLTRPQVTAPIIGPRDLAQLEGSLRAVSLAGELDAATLDRLDKIFPPYKTAPEDYAW
jgi:aryl-alcohol dehydrogenase-like predicted oxidoreductase